MPGVEADGPISLLKPVLASLESRIVYKRYYRSGYRLEKGLELLLFDHENPRSVAFQLDSLQHHLEALSASDSRLQMGQDRRCLLKAANTLLLSQPSELAQCDVENGRHVQLEALLLAMEEDLKATAQAIADRYFDHTAGPQLLDQGGRLSS